jgi:hypothetical protein
MANQTPLLVFSKVKQNGIGTTGDDIELDSSVSGYRDFVDVYNDGDRFPYWIEAGSAWEYGVGTLVTGSPHVLHRGCPIENSSNGSLITVGDGNACVLSVGPSPFADASGSVFATATGFAVTGDTELHRLGFTVGFDPWATWSGTATGGGSCFFYHPCWATALDYRLELSFSAVGATHVLTTVVRDVGNNEFYSSVSGSVTGLTLTRTLRLLDTTDDQFLRVELETDATGGLTVGATMNINWHL